MRRWRQSTDPVTHHHSKFTSSRRCTYSDHTVIRVFVFGAEQQDSVDCLQSNHRPSLQKLPEEGTNTRCLPGGGIRKVTMAVKPVKLAK